jgi:HAD superfamily hydrolase (TIGR01549 family)
MLTLPVETVIFDLDGTLRQNVPSADETQYRLAIELGVAHRADRQNLGARWAHSYWAQSEDLFADIERFKEMEADFWTHYSYRYLRALEVQEQQAQALAAELYQRMETEFKPENQLLPGVPETLARLKQAGYAIGLVSNRSRPCQEECENLGLLPHLDFAYVAAEVEAWKPDPRIFERALNFNGGRPERVVYVGDNYYADVVGAQNAGLQPVLIDPLGVFPEATCAVIRAIPDLLEWLT